MLKAESVYVAEEGYKALQEISKAAESNGTFEMTLEEINAEIEAVREERRAGEIDKSHDLHSGYETLYIPPKYPR